MTTKTHNGMTKRFVFGSEWNFMPEGRKSVNQRFEEELEANNLVCCLLPVLISTFMHFGLSPYFIFIFYSGLEHARITWKSGGKPYAPRQW
jgi:hypothetical protein